MLKGSKQALPRQQPRASPGHVHSASARPPLAPALAAAAPAQLSTPFASASIPTSALAAGNATTPGPSSRTRHCASPRVVVCAAAAAPAADAGVRELGTVDTSVGHYRCHSRDGAVVDARVEAGEGCWRVQLAVRYHNVPQERAPQELTLHWGLYRTNPSRWHCPPEVRPLPPDLPSAPWADPAGSAATRTALRWDAGAGCWAGGLQLPARLAPVHLAFALVQPATNKYDIPLRAAHFCVPVGMGAGSPQPLGASVVATKQPDTDTGASGPADPRVTECAINFAVFSRHASSMQLCLVRVMLPERGPQAGPAEGGSGAAVEAQNVMEIVLDPLTNRTGDVWHICVYGLKDLESLCWAWRADGEVLWQHGNRFHPGFLLLDPHAARVLHVALPPHAGAHRAAPRLPPPPPPGSPGQVAGALLGSLAAFVQPPFDWQGCQQAVRGSACRVRPLEEGVLLELDVRTFTSGPEAEAVVPPERRGKYLGVLDRLDQLRALGATTVLLTPVNLCAPAPAPATTASTPPAAADPSPQSWGAAGGPSGPPAAAAAASSLPAAAAAAVSGGRLPLSLLAPDPGLAVGGPLAAADELKQLIRGLHAAGMEVVLQVEFCLTAEGGDAGAGSLQGLRGLDHAVYYREGVAAPVLNCGHPVVRSLVLAALRHWAAEYRVEGFCVRNAENLAQDKFGSVLDNPPLAEDIAHDPLLRNLKLIAAVSDPALLPRLGERGFPHWGVWMQVNDRFRSDLTSYLVAGQRGRLSAVATRLTGSADLFAARWDAALPGGLAAGRRPAFGLNATAPLGDRPLQAVLAEAAGGGGDAVRCEALTRALLVAQFVSAGQPLVAASTLLAKPSTAQLAAALAAVRRGYAPLLCPPSLTSAERVLTWHSPYGGGGEPDWAAVNPDPFANVLVLTIGGGASRPGHMLAVVFNPNAEPATVALPQPPTVAAAGGAASSSFCWRLLVDTSRPVPTAAQPAGPRGGGASLGVVLPASEQGSYTVGSYGAVLLDAVPLQPHQPQPAAATPAPPSPAPPSGGPVGRPAAPPPGYGMSPAAAAAAAASKPPPPSTSSYRTVGGSAMSAARWPGDAAAGSGSNPQ